MIGGAKITSQSGASFFKFSFWGPAMHLVQQTIFSGIKVLSGKMAFTFYEKYQMMCWDQGDLNLNVKFLDTLKNNKPALKLDQEENSDRARLGPVEEIELEGPQLQEDDLIQGPPSGFEFPMFQFTGGPSCIPNSDTNLSLKAEKVRRSLRLLEKYTEKRKCYESGKKKYNKRINKPKKARLEYQQTLGPLEMEQAELVIQMAGVEVKGKMEEEVAKIVLG